MPLLPRLLGCFAASSAGLRIGSEVVIRPGVQLGHGQIVIAGETEIGSGSAIYPGTTIGPEPRDTRGPSIGREVVIGTGARLLGPITIGDGARIGANAVVSEDVPPGAVAIGVPARIIPAPGT